METIPPQIPDLTLLRRIGGGSYGDVWLARTVTGVYRAVKIVERSRFSDERPFLRELDGISQFQRLVGDRPRQLALMHVGHNAATGVLYYVMELADDIATGSDIDPVRYEPLTLKALHERQPVMPAEECIRLGVELARSLVDLHASGLIHRDIKLSNIIFVSGVPKLADIGLVAATGSTMTSLGTPGYAPPEGAGSLSADVYGLGKVLYEMATSFPPGAFPKLPPDLARRGDVALLLELNEVILRACEPDPRNRFDSVEEMLDQLLLLQAGKSIRELKRVQERLDVARRVTGVAVVLTLAVVAVLGAQNYFNLRKLAKHEAEARVRAETEERLARYTADLHRAQLSLLNHDTGLVRVALRRQIPGGSGPDLRGLEWNALWNETAGDETRILGVAGGAPVRALDVSPDGRLLAAQEGDETRETVVWDLQSGSRRVLAPGARGFGGFSPDATGVFVSGPDGVLQRLAVNDTDPDVPLSVPGAGGIVGRLDDGRTLIVESAHDNGLRLHVLDAIEEAVVSTWECEPELAAARVFVTALSRDRRRLAVQLLLARGPHSEFELQMWTRADDGGWTPAFRRRNQDHLRCLEFSPDGSRLAFVSADVPVTVVDADDGAPLLELAGHRGEVFDLEFSPDGQHLASAGEDETVRVWSLDEATGSHILRGHEAAVTALAWSGATRLFSASVDGTVREWDLGRPRRTFARGGFWNAFLGDFVYAPDAKTIYATTADAHLAEIDAQSLQPTGIRWAGAFHPLAVVGNRIRALTLEVELVTCDRETGTVERTGLRKGPEDRVIIANATADGRRILLGTVDGAVEFWDGDAAGVLARHRLHRATIFGGAFSADGRFAVTGDTGGVVRLWNAGDGSPLREIRDATSAVFCVALSPDGRQIAIGREDGDLTIVDAGTGEVVARRMAHSRGLNALAYSPDGTRLFTAGYDGVLIAWSPLDYREIGTLPVRTIDDVDAAMHLRPALLHFAPDSTAMTTFTEAGWLRRWDLQRP